MPHPEDELTDLERRLAGWTPSTGALSRDRMLFEAGRAAGRSEARVRRSTALAAGLAALAVGLGVWASREHAQRRALELALAERTRALEVALDAPRAAGPPPIPIAIEAPSPESYLSLSRRLATIGLDEPASSPTPPISNRPPEGPDRPLTPLNARRPGGLLDL